LFSLSQAAILEYEASSHGFLPNFVYLQKHADPTLSYFWVLHEF